MSLSARLRLDPNDAKFLMSLIAQAAEDLDAEGRERAGRITDRLTSLQKRIEHKEAQA